MSHSIAWDDAAEPDPPGPDPIGVAIIINGIQLEWFAVYNRMDIVNELRNIAEGIELGDYTGVLVEIGVTN